MPKTTRFPRHLEGRLAAYLVGRQTLIRRLYRELVADGETPNDALALVRSTMDRMPWEPAAFLRIAELADNWSTSGTAGDVAACVADPGVQATMASDTANQHHIDVPDTPGLGVTFVPEEANKYLRAEDSDFFDA